MDSGNSGSLHSSSGADEEYDSRAAADSIFMNTHPPPQPLFDPFSNYTQQLHHPNPNSFNDPDTPWPGTTSLRSGPNPNSYHYGAVNPFMHSYQPPRPPPAGAENTTASNNHGGGGVPTAARNPRKRSRASRRAPTTVLTTDTTNFRAMVQEFTGIPAPPFSNQPFPGSNSLDNLFGPRSAAAAFDATAAPYLRHPFAHGAQTTPFLVPSSTSSSNTPIINYQQLQFPQIQTSNHLVLNINNNQNQNPNPLFSSLFQTSSSKFVISNPPIMASKPHNQGPLDDIKPGPGLAEFCLGGHGNHATSTSDQTPARNDREDNADYENAAKWRRNTTTTNYGNDNSGDGYNQAHMKPVNEGYDFSGPTSSNFHGEKGPENNPTTRVGDHGMVESWIFSSEK